MRALRQVAAGLLAACSALVMVLGAAYVTASDSAELGPVPTAHITPSPAP